MSKPFHRFTPILLAALLVAVPAMAQTKAATSSPSAQAQVAKSPLDGLDAFVADAMKQWNVPGMAVAVVQDGKVTYAKGYGYRDVEKQLPVTTKTLFAIGSITKSFTVTLLGQLADEGKLDWDKPVREYLPTFHLYDPVATEHMTPRDLVTHRSGLPRHDLLWYGNGFTRKELFDRLRYLEPSKDFRSTYQYQNLMFMTAGVLASQVSGQPWEQMIRERIFAPLGMNPSNLSVTDSQKSADFALPYVERKEQIKLVPFRNIDQIGPAGSINSNAEDMARYVLLHLQKGKHEGKQILSEAQAAAMQTPQMVVPGALPYKEVGHSQYGMGLGVGVYRGHKVVSHGGGIDGFTALLTFLPQDGIGMIILTNCGGSALPTVVARNIFDRLLGLDPIPWAERFKEQVKKQKASEEEAKKKGYTPRREGTQPSHDLQEYAGEYEHPGYGIARVDREGEALKLTYYTLSAPLKHYHYDIFEVPDDPALAFDGLKVSFFTNVKGEIGSLSAPLEPNVKDIVFTRRGEKKERAELEPLVGEYALGATTVKVELQKDDKLTLTLPGQPTYELAPTKGLGFDIKGLNGYSVEFKKDDADRIVEMVFFQPNGTFVAKKK